jgi:hypothetical protein
MPEPKPSTSTVTDDLIRLPAADERDRDDALDYVIRMWADLPQASVTLPGGKVSEFPPGAPHHAESFILMVPLVEALLDGELRDISPALHARLAAMVMGPSVPEQLVLQIAFGREAGETHALKIVRLIAEAEERGLSVDDYIAELSAADAVPHDRIVRLFLGEAGPSPSAERIRRGIELLRRTASLVPYPLRPPLLCSIAWLQWARGRRAVAMAYVEEASRIEPDDVLAYGLSVHLPSRMPAWLDG